MAKLQLPRLRQTDPAFMQRAWEALCVAIETAFNDLAGFVEALVVLNGLITEAKEAADAANAAAAAAQTAASDASAAVEATTAATALANSSCTGLTITASDVGASASISNSALTRVYGDGTTAAVSGGTVTGLAYSTSYWVYYDAPKGTAGSVTYAVATTIQGNATGSPDRHFVGAVTTPAAAAPPVDGNPVLPPGANIP